MEDIFDSGRYVVATTSVTIVTIARMAANPMRATLEAAAVTSVTMTTTLMMRVCQLRNTLACPQASSVRMRTSLTFQLRAKKAKRMRMMSSLET